MCWLGKLPPNLKLRAPGKRQKRRSAKHGTRTRIDIELVRQGQQAPSQGFGLPIEPTSALPPRFQATRNALFRIMKGFILRSAAPESCTMVHPMPTDADVGTQALKPMPQTVQVSYKSASMSERALVLEYRWKARILCPGSLTERFVACLLADEISRGLNLGVLTDKRRESLHLSPSMVQVGNLHRTAPCQSPNACTSRFAGSLDPLQTQDGV